jgi:hypothetical protein
VTVYIKSCSLDSACPLFVIKAAMLAAFLVLVSDFLNLPPRSFTMS